MDTQRTCPSCGKPLAADAPQGICPECLMKAGFGTASGTEGGEMGGFIPPPVAAIARLFPQLEILELIGKGGMGAVYRARQPGLDRLVALKILPPRTGSDPGFAERFTREARALARLNHPNIVGVYDFGQVSSAGVPPASAAGVPPASSAPQPIISLHYFLMEYVDGPNLRQLEHASKLSPPQALQIIPQICEALQYAHDEGIVHRDIKPENVLLDKKGRVKIADFGLAKILGREPQDFHLTGAGQVMGTPHYMAPEQVEHPQEVDHRADLYSLGVVFYEMLTGELPLGKFAPPSRKVQVDVRLDEVVMHALENEPERRYQHASQIKSDVETIVNSGTAVVPAALSGSRPTEAAPSVSSRPASRPWALIVVAALFIANGCATAWETGHDLTRHIYDFNLELLALPIGIGLLRRRPWWRMAALVALWIDFALVPVIAGFALTGHMLPNATVKWMGREVTGPHRVWIGLGCCTLVVALLVWMYRALVRPDVKALFHRGPFVHPWIEWGALAGALALALTAGSGSAVSPKPREMRISQHFTAADRPLSGDLTLTEDGAWAATCTNGQILRLFEVPNPDVEQRTVIYRAKLKTDGLVGRAYLEMWCQLPGRGEFFSRGLDNTISGSTDWATCQTPFFLKAGEEPDLIRLNLVVEGRGKVLIKDVELLAGPLN